MAKGVSIKFRSYHETVPKLLEVIKFDKELKKHSKIVLKPTLKTSDTAHTPAGFVEAVLRFCLTHKAEGTEIYIAEGADGESTEELFEKFGYKALAERYGVSLLDLNSAEVQEIQNGDFLKFQGIKYPQILLESFVISLPILSEDPDTEMNGSLANMLGAFPAAYYRGFFSADKNKIKKWPAKYAIYDIIKCKMPEFAVIDASEKGAILAGIPLDTDIQAAKLLGKSVSHVKMIQESMPKHSPSSVKSNE